MSQPSYYATGTTPNIGDTKLKRWSRILGVYQNRSGAKASNNPLQSNTVRQIKKKVLAAINAGSSGGGGGGGSGPTDPDVIAFIACANLTDPTQITAVNTLVLALKSNNLWNSFDALYPFVGGNASAHSCNLKAPGTFSITWHGGVVHNAFGITGDGSTGYGDTGFNPFTASGHFTTGSASLGVYSRTATPQATYFMGVTGGGQDLAGLFGGTGPNSLVGRILNNANITLNSSDNSGSNIISRTSATAAVLYNPSGSQSAVVDQQALANQPFFVMALNFVGPPSLFFNGTLAFAFIGAAFTGGQVATLQTLILNYETTLNRN